jgi:glycosyltransferase involved in cell wall biosynthesis
LLSRLDGLVAVTHELEDEIKRARPGLPSRVIANGIELGPVDAPRASRTDERPRLVYIGEDVYWQGVDKLRQLAAAYPDWHFDLIGPAAGTSGNVTCHGYLDAAGYAPLLNEADVAIGTLALHRKQMDEACPLKVRRYLEFGLPVLLGYRDTDLDSLDAWWLLRLPNTESNVLSSLQVIESFVQGVRGRRVPRDEVEPVVSAAAKESARLAFFEEVVSPPGQEA